MKNLKQSLAVALWFIFLTFPLMVVKVNTSDQIVQWRWMNILWVGVTFFVLSFIWRYALSRKEARQMAAQSGQDELEKPTKIQELLENQNFRYKLMFGLLVFALVFPWIFDTYQSTIMISALIYVVLGLGLNITVGLAGLLDLGYVAFFAVGAYAYALLNHHFGIGFWICLPLGAAIGGIFGVSLGFPILRLRGDYLAIVTLGFGMIVKVVLENWSDFSFGPSGIANIDRPGLFGLDLDIAASTTYIYYIMIGLVILTIIVTGRLKNSRIGRAWIALREDEIACVAMGIDMARTKLSAYALGACWAGMVGVVFAAKTTFINPASFNLIAPDPGN